MELNDQQLLELGIEIVSAMKADTYGASIEDGRLMALEDTAPEYTLEYDPADPPIRYIASMKTRLHEQAVFVAKATMKKLNDMWVEL